MPISHKHKAIFVHIPKAGGSSIEKSMGVFGNTNKGYNEEKSEIKPTDIFFGKVGNEDVSLQHLPVVDIKKRVDMGIFEDYYKFTIVRNPYDKMASEYYWRGENSELSFKDFLRKKVKPNMDLPHFKKQSDYVKDEDGSVIVDFVGKFENLNEDAKKIFQKLGIKTKLPHIMKGKSNFGVHYSELYDEDARKLVEELYKEDLELFGYTFETLSTLRKAGYVFKKIKVPFVVIRNSIEGILRGSR